MSVKYKLIPIITSVLFFVNSVQLLIAGQNNGSKILIYLFGQLNIIGCVLLGSIVYYRHHQIKRLICQHSDLMGLVHLNRKAHLVGWLMCFTYFILSTISQEYGYIFKSVAIFIFFIPFTYYFLWQYEITLKIQSYVGSMELTCGRMNFALCCKWLMILLFYTNFIWIILFIKNHHNWNSFIVFCKTMANGTGILLIVISTFYISTFIFDIEMGSTQNITV